MLTIHQDHTIVLDTGRFNTVWAVAFHPDGIHLFGGSWDGLRRWRVAGGKEAGKQLGMDLTAISVSNDHRWILCGTMEGASVWDAKTLEKTIEVEGTNFVAAVDISPDSTRFATGTAEGDNKATIWDITTGGRLVGPLRCDNYTAGVKFSPDGGYIAVAVRDYPIQVFDSRSGDQLSTIRASVPHWQPLTPLAWSNNGQQIFVACGDNKIKTFEVSTGSQLAETQVHDDGDVLSITLAANGKFLASIAGRSILFWDVLTLTQIGSIVKDSQEIRSIAVSPDCSHLAIGGSKGKITIRHLSDILPDSYGPFHVSIHNIGFSDKLHVLVPIL